jgi:uncharacterized protein YdaU (DUF1376 family)
LVAKRRLNAERINDLGKKMNDAKPNMPYYKTFVGDELLDYRVQQLSLEEFGAFQKLKLLIWNAEKLPLDFKILGKLLNISTKKFENLWKNLSFLFEIEGENDQFIRHKELDEQRAKYADFLEKSRKAGQKSAEIRSNRRSTDLETSVEAIKTNTKQIQNKTEQNTHRTNESVCVSKHSKEIIDEYFKACEANGMGIKYPAGYRNHLQAGKADEQITDWLENGNSVFGSDSNRKLSKTDKSSLAIKEAKRLLREKMREEKNGQKFVG